MEKGLDKEKVKKENGIMPCLGSRFFVVPPLPHCKQLQGTHYYLQYPLYVLTSDR